MMRQGYLLGYGVGTPVSSLLWFMGTPWWLATLVLVLVLIAGLGLAEYLDHQEWLRRTWRSQPPRPWMPRTFAADPEDRV